MTLLNTSEHYMETTQNNGQWPELVYIDLKDTLQTVHLWTQIVGKIRLAKTPWINHGWHVTLYVSARGLTTGTIPYENGSFQIDFDFISHALLIYASDGGQKRIALGPGNVAAFYHDLFDALTALNIDVKIHAKPNELEVAVPFEKDVLQRNYEKAQMQKYWQALVRIDAVFTRFRASFNGKCSPVHFFWGAFDLAVTRFSGRTAPQHSGGAPNLPDRVMQEAYSHEVSSAGFWGGGDAYPFPAFYSYCYPAQEEFADQPVKPEAAFYSQEMGEFLLNYEDVQRAEDPEAALLSFLKTTYTAAAKTGNWNPDLNCNLTSFEK